MTTISTTQHQRTPLWIALAATGALVLGGAIGCPVEQADKTPLTSHSHATTPAAFGGATTSDEFSGSTSGSTHATGSPGGGTTTPGAAPTRRSARGREGLW